MVGKTLSHYRIIEELGRGGMGIVFKAEDTKLERTVAIKVLPAAALSNEDDRARFYREAKAAAALNHPNIAAVHEIDEAVPEGASSEDLRPFIAMEYIEGGTLDERIQQGPLKLKEAMRLAIQVADALKAAHAKEIVHRDIKSANIMLTEDGQAKVLDFGLAQTAASTKLTRMGSTLGTVAYMSPEQARGEEVDSRTDLYSLGAVIYEMISGRAPYGGEYEQAIVYSILNAEPEPLTAVRTGVPMELERLVNKLLAKEADRRYQSAADLIVDLEAIPTDGSGYSRTTGSFSTISAPVVQVAPKPAWQQKMFWPGVAAGVLLGLVVGFVSTGILGSEDSAKPLQRVEIALSGMSDVRFPRLSPNGDYLGFRAQNIDGENGIFLRDMTTGRIRRIENTQQGGLWEFDFSPDGGRIAFTELVNGGVFTVVIPNGIPERRTEFGRFAYWEDEETIVVNDDRPMGGGEMYRLDLSTNEMISIPVTGPELEEGYGSIVKTHVRGSSRAFGHQHIRVQNNSVIGDQKLFTIDLTSGKLELIESFAINPEFVRGGFLMYQVRDDDGELVVRPIDEKTGQFIGQPTTVLDDGIETRWGRYAVSPDGDVLFTSSRSSIQAETVLWIVNLDDRSSVPLDIILPEGTMPSAPQFSSDGSKIVFHVFGSSEGNVYLYDREESLSYQVTFDNSSGFATFSSDDSEIHFTAGSFAEGPRIARLRVDAPPGTEPDLVVEGLFHPELSPDGKWIAGLGEIGGDSERDLVMVDRNTRQIVWVDSTGERSRDPSFSPDSRYIAYGVEIAESEDLVVRPVSGVTRQVIPGAEGRDVLWSADGGNIYYKTDLGIHRIPVRTTPTFNTLGAPELVLPLMRERGWDISSDGRTVVVASRGVEITSEDIPEAKIFWYQNWSDYLKREFER